MTSAEELERQLAEGRIVPLAAVEWEALAAVFDEVARHHTMVAGDLVVVRTRAGLAAVERPTPDERVVRLLGDDTAARSFVEDRLAQYERMWDGCGCKVDYYA
jgi:hypothetical protein